MNTNKEKHDPFQFVEKNEIINEPKNLYVLSFGFTMPITRNSYKEEKTDALHLNAISKPGYGLYPCDLNKCVEGAYVLEDFAKSASLETQHGMKHGKYEIDADYYTAEWSFNRPDSDSYWIRNYVQCEQSWDIDMSNPKELADTKINFTVSIANENKELCYKEIKKLFEETQKYAKNTLKNEKNLVFNKDVKEMLKKVKTELEKKCMNLAPEENNMTTIKVNSRTK